MSATAVHPLSTVSRDAVTAYLQRRGHTAALVAWKYFDARFNRGSERAMVWLQRGEVRGFVGLIPFRMRLGTTLHDTAWTCDWSVENPERSPGIGILLLRAAIAMRPFTLAIGGNELTRSMMPRIARQTIDDAGLVFVRPLRLRYVLEKVDRRIRARISGAPALAETWLGSIPLPGRLRRDAAKVVAGVSPALEPLLDAAAGGSARPTYDLDYVDWQCGRCPDIDAWTCLAPGSHGERAAALIFRTHTVPSHWRMVTWFESAESGPAAEVVRAAIHFARERQAASLSVLLARTDAGGAAVLRDHGFTRQRGGQPLYVSAARAGSVEPLAEVRGVSYLDADLAYLP